MGFFPRAQLNKVDVIFWSLPTKTLFYNCGKIVVNYWWIIPYTSSPSLSKQNRVNSRKNDFVETLKHADFQVR